VFLFLAYVIVAFFPLQVFEANDLFQGQNFSKVLNCLVALNKATSGEVCVCVCVCLTIFLGQICTQK